MFEYIDNFHFSVIDDVILCYQHFDVLGTFHINTLKLVIVLHLKDVFIKYNFNEIYCYLAI